MVKKSELCIYIENKDFVRNTSRKPIIEFFRWFVFALRVLGKKARDLPDDEAGIYGSLNTHRSLSLYLKKGQIYNIFGECSDGAIFKRFYILLIKAMVGNLWYVVDPRAYRKGYYYFSVQTLYNQMYKSWLLYFSENKKIKKLWFSNDFLFQNRAMIVAASQCGIKVNYVQHGEIGKNFPPLDHFSSAFLYDESSLAKYPSLNSNTKIIFTRDKARLKPVYKPIRRILLCINNNEEIDILCKMARVLSEAGKAIVVRSHKYVDKNLLPNIKGVNYETISTRSINESLENADLCIAGNSSVLGDAIFQNCMSIYIHTYGIYDYYEYVQRKLIPEFKDYKELTDLDHVLQDFYGG